MQSALLVQDGDGNIIAKCVYAGNLTARDIDATRLRAAYPTCSVTVFNSDQDTAFTSAVVSNPNNIVIR